MLPRDNKRDIDLTDTDLNVSGLGEALEQAERSTRAPSPDTPEPASPAATEETAFSVNTRRNTMSLRDGASNTGQAEPVPNPTTQREDAKKLKLKEPDVFRGERPTSAKK